MTPALAVYGRALRAAATGRTVPLVALDDRGRNRVFDAARWCGGLVAGDPALLDRCDGPTLDVGCGPGRLTAALTGRGQAALGVDLCRDAVRLARGRGAAALRRDVFAPLPGEGRWRRLLLADGNIGIGGDPVHLLARCGELIAADGEVLAETDPPCDVSWSGTLRVCTPDGPASAPFPWAYVSAADLAGIARTAALRVLDTWTEAGRWFARLGHR